MFNYENFPVCIYDNILFGGNIISHVLSFVDVIISHFLPLYFFCLVRTLLQKQQVTSTLYLVMFYLLCFQ